MIRDITTVAWKDWKLQFRQGESQLSARLKVGVLLVAGVLLARQFGSAFSTSMLSAWFGAIFGCLSTIPGVAATFAGEREEKTLEWLLSTRMSEIAIVLGKQLAIVANAVCFGAGLVVAGIAGSIAFGGAQLAPAVQGGILVATVALTLSLASVVAAIGMLVSLKAVTTRHALNALTFLIVWIAVVPLIFAELIPELPQFAQVAIPDLTRPKTIASIVLSAIVIDAALCALILMRFSRARMILERVPTTGRAS